MCYTTTVMFDCEHSHTEARPGSLCAGGLLRLQREEQEQADSNSTDRRDSNSSNGSSTSSTSSTSSNGSSAQLATRMSCWDEWPQGHMRREGLCAACTFRLRTYGTPEPSMALLVQALKKAGVKKSGAK